MAHDIVWEFTNQRKLNKKEFLNYVERKVFRTIRKFEMLPENRKIFLKKSEDLNTVVLKHILEQKFPVSFSTKSNFSSKNLSDISEEDFKNILNGKFEGIKNSKKLLMPLCDVSDKEIEVYASLVGLKGKKAKRDERIQELFARFMKKNPDLEHNIVNAMEQIHRI
jgi:tRNA(Ile)-lysidine synthase TilS/MesJ